MRESEGTEKQPVNHIFIGYLDGADPFRVRWNRSINFQALEEPRKSVGALRRYRVYLFVSGLQVQNEPP